jgi:hypothetical protein
MSWSQNSELLPKSQIWNNQSIFWLGKCSETLINVGIELVLGWARWINWGYKELIVQVEKK